MGFAAFGIDPSGGQPPHPRDIFGKKKAGGWARD